MRCIMKMVDGTRLYCVREEDAGLSVLLRRGESEARRLLDRDEWTENSGFTADELACFSAFIDGQRDMIAQAAPPSGASAAAWLASHRLLMGRAAFVLLLALFALLAMPVIVRDIAHQLEYAYCSDAAVYFGAGKGIAKGVRLYTGLFDTKPPAIHYLSALSYLLTGDFYLCIVFSLLAAMTCAAVPALSVFGYVRKTDAVRVMKAAAVLGAAVIGGSLAFYVHSRSGHVQTEAFGAAFVCLYLLLVWDMPEKAMKPFSPRLLAASALLMMGPMFKEPFVLTACAAALVFIRTPKDALYKLILPMILGGVMGVLFLLVTGNLVPFITVYLKYMMSDMVGGSLERSVWVHKLVQDLRQFSPWFCGAVVLSFIAAAADAVRRVSLLPKTLRGLPDILLTLVRLPLGVWLTTYAVGTTGAYFGHHFIFAVPFYAALMIYALSLLLKARSAVLRLTVLLAAAVMACVYPSFNMYETGLLHDNPEIRAEAAWIDEAMDAAGAEGYQYFGFNQDCIFMYTEHLPLGPIYYQDWTKVSGSNVMGESLLAQLASADVAVVQEMTCGDLNDTVQKILEAEFTQTPPKGVSQRPEKQKCRVWFRRSE